MVIKAVENCGYRPHPQLLMATAHEGSWQGSGGTPGCGRHQAREEPSVLRSLGVTLALPDLFPFHLNTPQKCSDWTESFHLHVFTGALLVLLPFLILLPEPPVVTLHLPRSSKMV